MERKEMNTLDHLDLARWQFAITTIYHFLFVPLSIGLVFTIALMQTFYVVKKEEMYRRMAQFWGKLFLLNFAVGVVTGIMQEFQFGMNWSSYSRYVGDIFGGPLAIEALVSFFMESVFIGLWIFGWDRLPKKLHLTTIWLVALGTMTSALWILTANSFMQEPMGFVLRNGRAEMTDFFALLSTKQLWVTFPHVVVSALCTGSIFVAGISAYKLLRGEQVKLFKASFQIGMIIALVSSVLTAVIGHEQAQYLVEKQPMKLAASEALWETSSDPAPWTVAAWIDPDEQRNSAMLEIPGALSLLSYNKLKGSVPGMLELQKQYEAKYGPGNYIPPVRTTFWSFRIMVVSGGLLILLSLWGIVSIIRNKLMNQRLYLRLMVFAIALPYIANTAGWIMREVGRQPWIVFGLQTTADGVSPTVSAGMVATSLIGFTLIYGILAAVLVYLFIHFIKKDQLEPIDEEQVHQSQNAALL
jgi:cytochrome bd ubiquinol oxidase subunit I